MGMLSLQRGLDILSAFGDQNDSMSSQQIAACLDLPLSTVYRYLDVLSERQYLTKDPATKLYGLGTAIYRLVAAAGNELPVVSAATPHMETLAKKTNETVYLTILKNYRSLCVKKIESKRRVRLTMDEGTHQPLHTGASSRILLAYQNARFFDRWYESEGMSKMTTSTICEPEQMKKVIAQTKQQGYTVSDGETDEGAMAIAAPVFSSDGRLRAGLSLAGPRERISPLLDDLVKRVCSCAQHISQGLGYHPAASGATHEQQLASSQKEVTDDA
jgi:DNA-binding IclR family transcriptional regulator